jgi:hypothetical protein
MPTPRAQSAGTAPIDPARAQLVARTGRVLATARKAQENSEEKGVETLYLAVGFASWQSSDGGRDPQAPVFLLPLQMKRKGKELSAIEVQVAGEPQVNPVLLHVLAEQTGIQVSGSRIDLRRDAKGIGRRQHGGDRPVSVLSTIIRGLCMPSRPE